jgi:DNA-binding winged helix-turn-helix (wHTH) protein
MPVLPKQRLCFGPFELDAQSAELFKFGQKLKLQGQPIQILSILLEKPGELFSRRHMAREEALRPRSGWWM